MLTRIKFLIILLLSFGYLRAQSNYQVRTAEIAISGTSTLHDWTSKTSAVTASGKLVVDNGNLADITSLKATIPVTSIKSEKGKTMDNKTHKALMSEEHPNITFQLQSLDAIEAKGQDIKINATGLLTIAGKSKKVNLTAKCRTDGMGSFHFTGSKAMKMSDFGIDPPTALLGTLKTGDDITVSFDLNLVRTEKENSN